MKVLVPLAENFEEVEALTVVDVLRRAGIDVTTASIDKSKNQVTSSHAVTVVADTSIFELDYSQYDAIVLPGGMPGSRNLQESKEVSDAIKTINDKDGFLAAICAAPFVLGSMGLLKGKNATCYPGFEAELLDAKVSTEDVVCDGKIITGTGVGVAMKFALTLVSEFLSPEEADKLSKSMLVK